MRNYKDIFDQYIKWVHENPRKVNKWVALAVKRHEEDLERAKKNDPEFPYIFDEEKADKICKFGEALKLSKDQWAGQNIVLMDWQVFVLRSIYGWVYKDTGLRRFRKAYIFVARKNGKSSLLTIPAIYDLLATPGAEVYCAGSKRDQAKRVWDECANQVRQDANLQRRTKILESTSRIVNIKTNGYMAALSADNKRFDGLNPSLVIVDELAAQKNMDTIKILQSGMGSRPEPLLFEITSGSDDLTSAGKIEFDRSCKILDRVFYDESYFCILYCIDEEDNWEDESKWIKANPSLGVTVNVETMKKLCLEAKQNPSLRQEFITKQCARWAKSLKSWIQPEVWRKCESEPSTFDISQPYEAIGAVDLSKISDLTAFTVCLYQNGKYFMEHHFYFPIEQLRKKIHTDNELWDYWLGKGYLTATPGNVISYDQMYQDIRNANEKYKLREVLFDPYNAQNTLIANLDNELTLVEVAQNLRNLSPFIKGMEEEIYKANIHDPNPVLKWMMSNAEVYRDPNDNVKIVKPDANAGSSQRIDGVITSAMCIGRIKQLLTAGEIDLRSNEEKLNGVKNLLSKLKWS